MGQASFFGLCNWGSFKISVISFWVYCLRGQNFEFLWLVGGVKVATFWSLVSNHWVWLIFKGTFFMVLPGEIFIALKYNFSVRISARIFILLCLLSLFFSSLCDVLIEWLKDWKLRFLSEEFGLLLLISSNTVWIFKVSRKVCIWLATRGVILTAEYFRKGKVVCVSWCYMFKETEKM